METAAVLTFLGICSVEDIWKRKIHLGIVMAFFVLGLWIKRYNETLEWKNVLGGMTIGLLVMIGSLLSKEQVGKGDAAMLITSGIYLGFWDNLTVFGIATVAAAVISMFLYIFLKKPGSYRIPFAPFLLIACILVCFWGGSAL